MASTGNSLSELLHYDVLTGIVREPANGVPEDILPPAFMNLTRAVEGRQVQWTILANTRQTAKSVQPGAPSVRRELKSVGVNSATIPRFADNIMIDGDTLTALRAFDNPARQQKGQQWVDYQVAEAGRRFRNTRAAMIYSLLRNGEIYLKSDGNGGYDLLANSTGADITVTMQVPANNLGSLNGMLTDWSASSTDVIDELLTVMEQGRKTSGLPIRHVFYGPNIRGYLLANDQVKEILKSDSGLATSMRQGVIPNGFGHPSLQWHPMQEGFFEADDGTNSEFFTGDEVTFTPEPTRDWYEMLEGTELVPSGALGVESDANAALNNLTEVSGRASYATIQTDPAGIKNVNVDNVLPTIKVPSAVFIGDATN